MKIIKIISFLLNLMINFHYDRKTTENEKKMNKILPKCNF